MKGICILMAIATADAARPTSTTAQEKVAVCLAGDMDDSVRLSQLGVSKIFAGIGVTIEWWHSGCPEQCLMISLVKDTPTRIRPGALAYARPYERTRIVVFYDRVRRTVEANLLPQLLAYVLAHEIGHVLQRMDRHSDYGIMKARWKADDYLQMNRGLLAFTAEDVEWIHAGMKARDGQRELATSTVPRSAAAAEQNLDRFRNSGAQ